jgi:ABC-2 type transport system ATP-binding protein
MTMVERFCHRALLLTDGRIELIGDPHDVGRRYIERNFETFREGAVAEMPAAARAQEPDQPDPRAEITDVWVESQAGERVNVVAHGDTLRMRAVIEAKQHVRDPIVDFWVDDEEGARILATSTRPWDEQPPLEPGDRLEVTVETRNILDDGRYHVGCSLLSGSAALDIVALVNRHKPFHVYGADQVYGLIEFDHTLRVDRRR